MSALDSGSSEAAGIESAVARTTGSAVRAASTRASASTGLTVLAFVVVMTRRSASHDNLFAHALRYFDPHRCITPVLANIGEELDNQMEVLL